MTDLSEGDFELGVVVVTVNCDGREDIQDWNPLDAEDAKIYAEETSYCYDVDSVKFYNALTNEDIIFIKGECSPAG